MHCEKFRNQSPDYLSGALEAAGPTALEQHLAECASCREEAAVMRSLWMKLSAIAVPAPDSSAMRSRFENMLAIHESLAAEPESARLSLGNTMRDGLSAGWWLRLAALCCLAVGLFGAGVIAGRQYPSVPELQTGDVTAMRAELRGMRQMLALSLIQQQSASERLRGLSWSHQIDQPGSELLSALVDTLMHDPNVNVRLAAVNALHKFAENPMVRRGALQALGERESPLLQMALIDFMVDVQERESLATLRSFAQNAELDEAVRQRAAWGVEQFQ